MMSFVDREEAQSNTHAETSQTSMAEERDECCDGQPSFNVSNVSRGKNLNDSELRTGWAREVKHDKVKGLK